MLYDVLLALFGHTGDIIVESEKKNGKYKVLDEIKLSTSERSAVTAILKTGQLYMSIKQFCIKIGIGDYYSDVSVLFVKDGSKNLVVDYVSETAVNLGTKNLVNSNGYYMIAFCNGIQRYLNDYRKLLLTLEDVATSVKVLPTSTFTIIMRDQNKILHCLQSIILDYQNVSERHDERDVFSKSGDLLEILSERPKDKSVREIYAKLRGDVLSFLKFQLRNWICSGNLLDPYGEFVIGYRDLKNVNQDCQIPLNTRQTSGGTEMNYHSRMVEYEWNYKFYIKVKRGSTFGPIDYKTSKSILFIGKVIRVLSRSLNDFSINRTGIKKNLYSEHLVNLADKHIFDVWSKISTDRDSFQESVETYRKYVSALFREFVDRNMDIKQQLKLFKDVYLMGDDGIYNRFFEETYEHMSRKYNEKAFKLINKEFGKAISGLARKDENVNDKFEYIEGTDSGKLEDKDKDSGVLSGNGSVEHVMSRSNLSKSKELSRMGSSDSSAINSYGLIKSSEMSSYSHESADMEEMMRDYELNISQTDKIEEEESFEMFKHINDFNINSKFIKINKVKHKDSVIVGGNSSIWHEQMVYIMNSFNISLVANLSKIKKCKQFSVILSSKCFNSFENGQENELETKNTKTCEKSNISNSMSDSMCDNGDDINRGDEKSQKNNNKSLTIYSKETTFKHNSKNKELQKVESKLSEVLEMSSEIKSFDIIELLKLMSDSLYIGIINHTPEGTNRVTSTSKKVDTSTKKVKDGKKNKKVTFDDNEYDLMPYYKDLRFIKNSRYAKSIRKVMKRYTNEEENPEDDIGINEWIYLLLNYKYRYINFVNIKSYNNMFQIIFTIKRCLHGLEKKHIIDNKVRRDFTNPKNSFDEYCNLFRKLYAFKYYLQTNLKLILSYFYNGIIEPKYAELQSFVRQSKDFQLIKTKHHVYVENILR
ncbi:uncharacterized protein TOT_020000709 [Theileria orientalis strain Shintoku]|uniref:Spindle pole body component n=1 Tax=Theileria orientalis strain Shintoku TaxID=869250 RepID=J4C8A6_THEOR|nr:uncharacterized protein TOT_020000709 [Theileria orientalis strain Shintoku]BAM40453.1 uncharacterized protein TOT_020000709 [Theileria orientalis strain Shintoku]|eukprot:XP_009690754.1 uncharacterized protein TOT_020000709 [Theileria orientalis strain Shintoku]